MFSPTVAPQVLEGRRRAGEVDAGQVGVGERHLGDVEAVAGQHVDDARRQAGLLEQLHVSGAASCWVGDGFQMTVLPIRAGAVGRLPAIAVKLNGVIA